MNLSIYCILFSLVGESLACFSFWLVPAAFTISFFEKEEEEEQQQEQEDLSGLAYPVLACIDSSAPIDTMRRDHQPCSEHARLWVTKQERRQIDTQLLYTCQVYIYVFLFRNGSWLFWICASS